MDNWIVRLSSLTLEGIKNVGYGRVVMPHVVKKTFFADRSEILGIYGQNGSGKTSVVDALYYLQRLLSGRPLDSAFVDYLDVNSNWATIRAEFVGFLDGTPAFEAEYSVQFEKKDAAVIINNEALDASITENGKRHHKTNIIRFGRDESETPFLPQVRLNDFLGKNKSLITDIIVSRKLAKKENSSYIFNRNFLELAQDKADKRFQKYWAVISAIFRYAFKDVFVIRSTETGLISANLYLPMTYRLGTDEIGERGSIPIPLREAFLISRKDAGKLQKVLDQINHVLFTIIPGMQLKLRNYGEQALDSGEPGIKMELMSVRPGKNPFPIRMESDGIIKIISILNALIQAFGKPSVCLVVDELDAGIYEYMLGELLRIFQESGKGQLVFTSHNLRPLETLDTDSIMFSTTNPANRYIHFKSVKGTNNLRRMYLRSISVGGQAEELYDETDSLKITRAFRKAGRTLGDA